MADYEYDAKLLDQAVLVSLVRMEKQMKQFEQTGDKSFKRVEKTATDAFKKIESASTNTSKKISTLGQTSSNIFNDTGKSADFSAVKIGVIGGIVGGLVNQFIELGRQAVSALVEIGERSVQTALEFDTLRARLLGIFEGSEEAADATFNFIRDRSKALGIDLGQLAGAFLPKTESLDQFERVSKIATALAASDPEQGAIGARIALIEALSGTFTSLQRRFEIPKEDIDRIKEAFDTQGMEGFITTLEQVLKESGKDFDTLANTAQTSFNQIGQAATEKLGQLGEPIVEALQRAAESIGVFLEQNDTEITLFVTSIGDAIASVIDFLASIDFSQIDTQSLIETGQYIFRVVEALQLFIGQAAGFLSTIFEMIDSVTPLGEAIAYLVDIFSRLDEALVTASQILALSKAGWEGIYASIQPLVYVFEELFNAITLAQTGNLAAAADHLGNAVDQIESGVLDLGAGTNAFAASLQESITAMDEYNQAISDQENSQAALRDELEASDEAGQAAADAILAQKQAARDAAQALDEYEAALEKVTEAQAKFETELEQRGSDIGIDAERKRFDAMQDFAEKRAQAARKDLQKIEDIERDFGRDLEDNERDRSRAFLDQAKEEAQERVDIETDFQRRLEEIRSQFGADLEEAERNRDAITFLRLQRQQQEEIQQAQTTRDQDIEDSRLKGEQKRDELRTQQERENEDARIAMDRKLEDQRIAQARELEEIRFAEMIKEAEIQTWQERQFEDLKLWGIRKQEELTLQLAAELEIIKNYEEAKTQVVEEQNARRAAAARGSPQTSLGSTLPPTPGSRPTAGGTPHGTVRRQAGGPVGGGVPYLVGERGPELFTPGQAGYILPNNPAIMALAGQSSAINNISNSTTYNGNFSMLRPDALTPTQMAIVENLAVSVFRRINGG